MGGDNVKENQPTPGNVADVSGDVSGDLMKDWTDEEKTAWERAQAIKAERDRVLAQRTGNRNSQGVDPSHDIYAA